MVSEHGGVVIVGGSAGLGHGLSCGLPSAGDTVWLINRSRPPSLDRNDGVDRTWLRADLADPAQLEPVVGAIGSRGVRLLLYCAGCWEADPEIEQIDAADIYRIVAVNTAGFIALTKSLAPALRASASANVIAIGSTYGLDNGPGGRPAYAASKFGLRGAVNGFRSVFRGDRIAVTCISPGSLASEADFDAGADHALQRFNSERMPIQDMVSIINCLQCLSPASCAKEIILPAMLDFDA